MLETWSAVEIILGFVVLCGFGSPVLYAWADRWLDRTRNKITDAVTNGKEE